MTFVALLCRLLLGLTFFRAGLVKARSPHELRIAIENYKLLPSWVVPAVAGSLAPIEIAVGVAMLIGLFTGPVAALSGLVLIAFATAVSINLRRGRIISCGCAGAMSTDITWRHVLQNVVLVGAAAICSVWAKQPLSFSIIWGRQSDLNLTNTQVVALLMAIGSSLLTVMITFEGMALLKLRKILQTSRIGHATGVSS